MIRLALTASAFLYLASLSALAAGPTGIGDLKLGMTHEQLEAVSSDSVVYLTTPLAPLQSKHYKHVPGVDVFTAMVQTPFDPSPLHGAFKFTDGSLISISISLKNESNAFDVAKGMLSEKYGEARVVDEMNEEQCVLRNGANYKVQYGKLAYSWWSEPSDVGYVETQLVQSIMDGCAISRVAGGAIESKSVVITRHDQKPEKPANPF